MYWRVRKLTPALLLKSFGIYAVLIVSLLSNLVFMARGLQSKAIGPPAVDYKAFTRQVTRHLFDASYITIEDSMTSLNQEMHKSVLAQLQQNDLVPKDQDALRALIRQLAESQSVSCIQFDSIDFQAQVKKPLPDSSRIPVDMLPVELKIRVVVHDNEGVRLTSIKMRYFIADAEDRDTHAKRAIVCYLEQLPDHGPTN